MIKGKFHNEGDRKCALTRLISALACAESREEAQGYLIVKTNTKNIDRI